MNTKLLLEIGFTNNEVEVYMTLLKSGSVKVGELLKELSLHRSRVYESLNRLMEKGLVSSVIKNNISYFEATNPERLVTYVEEQKEILDEKQKELNQLIPELKKQISPLKPHAEAHVLVGPEGFKTMRKDALNIGETIYLIGGKGKEDRVLKYFFPQFDRMRIKKKIKWKILYDQEAKGKAITMTALTEKKFLPKEYSTPTVVNIYGNRVVSVLWKGDYPLCFMIINKDIADSYRKWFELLWKTAK